MGLAGCVWGELGGERVAPRPLIVVSLVSGCAAKKHRPRSTSFVSVCASVCGVMHVAALVAIVVQVACEACFVSVSCFHGGHRRVCVACERSLARWRTTRDVVEGAGPIMWLIEVGAQASVHERRLGRNVGQHDGGKPSQGSIAGLAGDLGERRLLGGGHVREIAA